MLFHSQHHASQQEYQSEKIYVYLAVTHEDYTLMSQTLSKLFQRRVNDNSLDSRKKHHYLFLSCSGAETYFLRKKADTPVCLQIACWFHH